MSGCRAAELPWADLAQELLGRGLRRGCPARLQVQGDSMQPLIRGGDWVEVSPLRSVNPVGAVQDGVVLGRVALAQSATGELICHRVLGQRAGRVQLAGDHCSAAEECPASAIIGFVEGVERGSTVIRLDSSRTLWLDRWEAILHGFSIRYRGYLAGLGSELLRRLVLRLRGFGWTSRAYAQRVWQALSSASSA